MAGNGWILKADISFPHHWWEDLGKNTSHSQTRTSTASCWPLCYRPEHFQSLYTSYQEALLTCLLKYFRGGKKTEKNNVGFIWKEQRKKKMEWVVYIWFDLILNLHKYINSIFSSIHQGSCYSYFIVCCGYNDSTELKFNLTSPKGLKDTIINTKTPETRSTCLIILMLVKKTFLTLLPGLGNIHVQLSDSGSK